MTALNAPYAGLRALLAPSLALFVACASHTPALAPTAPTQAKLTAAASAALPYKLELVEVPLSTLPALQSFSTAVVDGKWLVLGGRSAGLHGFTDGTNNFPRTTANTVAYVIDPAANRVLGSVDLVQALPAALSGPLTATNAEFVQVGTALYIVGGYGQDLESGHMKTFGSLIEIDAPALINAIVQSQPIASAFKQIPAPDDRLKVTGAELKYYQGVFYLAFGQDFSGIYSIQNHDYNRAGGQFQKYTEKVRVFTLNPDLSIAQFNQIDAGYDPSLPYNRRDLNVVDTVLADGVTPDAMVYGGVFKAGQIAGQLTPIEIGLSNSVTNANAQLESQFSQGLSHYTAANFTIFDATSKSCFTTLFGGISQYHYDPATNTMVLDALDLGRGVDGLPFIDTVSTIERNPTSSGFAFTQTIQPLPLPALLGAEAQFHPSQKLGATQLLPNGVINLAGLTQRTLVGYVYGGIESLGPYSTLVKTQPATFATGRLFQVYVTPGATPVIPMPPLPPQPTPYPPTP